MKSPKRRAADRFPEWAPIILVEMLIGRRGVWGDLTTFLVGKDPEIVRLLAQLPIFFLANPNAKKILGKLVTDIRMKAVWRTLDKRRGEKKSYAADFWVACQTAITGWKGYSKRTASEKRKHMTEIAVHARALHKLMRDSEELSFYSVVDAPGIGDLVKQFLDRGCRGVDTEIMKERDNFRSLVSGSRHEGWLLYDSRGLVPTMHEILNDIAEKATAYANEKPLVGKPNSENAEVHYFMRQLSGFLRKEYGQPLHEVVSATTSVIFEKDIDADLVRRITRDR